MTAIALRPPGPKPKPLVGNLLEYQRDPLGFFVMVARDYGDVARFMSWPFAGYVLNHPDYIKDLLVTRNKSFTSTTPYHLWLKKGLGEGVLTSNGDLHLRQRRMMQPAFHRQRIAAYAAVMTKHGAQIPAQRWHDGETRDIQNEMMRITLAVVAEALFGAHVEAETEPIGEAMAITNDYLSSRPEQFLAELWHRLPLPSTLRYRKAQAMLDRIVYRFIEERRASGQQSNDLLSLLLDAQDVEGDGGRMDDRELHDEVLTLFAAGHETTATALTWTWYLLSQHPEVEQRFHAELDRVLGSRTATLADMNKLSYAHMLFSESLRLYPPAWALGRIAMEDYEVGGYVLPKGSLVSVSPYVTHRDPRFFPEPERFDPMRWTKDEEAKRPKFSYYPFGAGPRQCIGEQFAWMEAMLILATVGQHWRMRLAPDAQVKPEPWVTLRARYGMKMKLERRDR